MERCRNEGTQRCDTLKTCSFTGGAGFVVGGGCLHWYRRCSLLFLPSRAPDEDVKSLSFVSNFPASTRPTRRSRLPQTVAVGLDLREDHRKHRWDMIALLSWIFYA